MWSCFFSKDHYPQHHKVHTRSRRTCLKRGTTLCGVASLDRNRRMGPSRKKQAEWRWVVGAEAAWLPRVWPQLQCNACKQATSAALVSFPRSRAGTHRRRATTGSRLSQLTGSAHSALPYLTRFETNADAYDIFFKEKRKPASSLALLWWIIGPM